MTLLIQSIDITKHKIVTFMLPLLPTIAPDLLDTYAKVNRQVFE